MPKKRLVRKKTHIKANNAPDNSLFQYVSLLFVWDGFFRIFFALFGFSRFMIRIIQSFQMRWFFIGLVELICAYGLLKRKKWALYVLSALSVYRIYTILFYIPKVLLPPGENNLLFYSLKIISVISIFYLFTKRKSFT
jgi:hypothetical protein